MNKGRVAGMDDESGPRGDRRSLRFVCKSETITRQKGFKEIKSCRAIFFLNKEMERQAADCEKYSQPKYLRQDLYPKYITRNSHPHNNKKTNNPKQWTCHFTKKWPTDTQTSTQRMVIKETQINAHSHPPRMANIKMTDKPKSWGGCGRLGLQRRWYKCSGKWALLRKSAHTYP